MLVYIKMMLKQVSFLKWLLLGVGLSLAGPQLTAEARVQACDDAKKELSPIVAEGFALLRNERALLAWSLLAPARLRLESSFCPVEVPLSLGEGQADLLLRARLAELLALQKLREEGEVSRRLAALGPQREMAKLLLAIDGSTDHLTGLSAADQQRYQRLLEAQPPLESAWAPALSSALIPGLGQAMQGAYQSAAIAFLLNAIAISATAEFVRRDLPSAALASGFVASVVYFGNIGAAAQLVQRRNRLRLEQERAKARAALFPEFQIFFPAPDTVAPAGHEHR